jgi:hypothetical protein
MELIDSGRKRAKDETDNLNLRDVIPQSARRAGQALVERSGYPRPHRSVQLGVQIRGIPNGCRKKQQLLRSIILLPIQTRAMDMGRRLAPVGRGRGSSRGIWYHAVRLGEIL